MMVPITADEVDQNEFFWGCFRVADGERTRKGMSAAVKDHENVGEFSQRRALNNKK